MMQDDSHQQSSEHWTVSSSVELITRSSAAAVLLVYSLGFIIVAFHDAKYGIVQFSPFRARTVLVGFVFTSLLSLSVAAQHYGFARMVPIEPILNDSAPERHLHRGTILSAGFVFTAGLMATIFGGFLFLHNPSPNVPKMSGWRVVLFVAIAMSSLEMFRVAAKLYLKRPAWSVVLSLVGFGVYLIVLVAPAASGPTSYLAIMLSLVGWHVTWIKREKNLLRFALDFRNWITALLVIWLYISSIFGDMPQRWGGGQPSPVQIVLIAPTMWAQSNPLDALLLDETDEGLYVLLSPAGRAFFISKTNVASIFFGTKDELARK
jgi:hypothetical protein